MIDRPRHMQPSRLFDRLSIDLVSSAFEPRRGTSSATLHFLVDADIPLLIEAKKEYTALK